MDPGLDTGLSLLHITPDQYRVIDHQVVTYAPDISSSPVMVLKSWKESHSELPHVLVYENFHVRPGKVIPDTTALKVIGGVEHWIMTDHPYQEVVVREPVQGKHMITDRVLTNAGLYVDDNSESRHVRDAHRHAAAYLEKIKHLPFCRNAWPPRSVECPHDHP